MSFPYYTTPQRPGAMPSVRRLLQDASAMLLPEKHFPRFSVGKGGKSMKRRIACLAVCLLAVLLPLRALAAEDRRRPDTRRGLGALTQRHAGRRAAFPRHAHAAYRRELDGTQRVFPRRRVSRAHGGPRRRRGVNASYYTLVTGARSKESAFALHLAARFSARESVCLTVEWTARLGDGCVTGAEGNRVFLTAVSESGQTAASSSAAVFRLRLFRFPRCALCRCARGGSSAAVRLLPALL